MLARNTQEINRKSAIADPAEIRRFLKIQCPPDSTKTFEIRCIPSGNSIRFDAETIEAAVRFAASRTQEKGIYFTINSIDSTISRSASDKDIVSRDDFFIDIDSERPDHDLSATNEERGAVSAKTNAIIAFVCGDVGFPEPIRVDSGNGEHLHFPIDMPNDEPSRELIKKSLQVLADRFNDEKVKIDTVVHNASRIARLPGTVARKGIDTPDRPHRTARILSVPDELEAVPTELFDKLLSLAPLRREQRSKFAILIATDSTNVYASAALEREISAVANAKPGSRNTALNKAAFALGGFVASGELDRSEVVNKLRAAALSAGLEEREIDRTIRSAFVKGMHAPRTTPAPVNVKPAAKAPRRVRIPEPFKPFPTESLPEPIRRFVDESAAAIDCDPSYVALPALAVAASLIGATRSIRLKTGILAYSEPAIVWAITIGESGTKKSPGWKYAMEPIFRLQRRYKSEYDAAMETYQMELQAWQSQKNKKASPKPAEPTYQHAYCGDATFEAVVEMLEDRPRGILVSSDEISSWFQSFTRYKGKGGGSDAARWIEMHGAGQVPVDRRTGERKHKLINRAAASVCGSIQPGILRRAMDADFLDSGFAARLLMAMPPRRPNRWTEADIEDSTVQSYIDLIDRLAELQFDDDEFDPKPVALKFKPDARDYWIAFHDRIGERQEKLEGSLASAFSKLLSYSVRFALIHHVVTHVGLDVDDRRPIGIESCKAGIVLAEWFAGEATRIYQDLATTQEDRETIRLIETIKANGGKMTSRLLHHNRPGSYPTSDDAKAALQALAEQGYGTVERVRMGRKGKLSFCFTLATSTPTTPTNDDDDPDDDDPDDDPTTTCYANLKSDRSGDRAKPLENKGIEDAADLVGVVGVDVADFFGNRESSEQTSTGDSSQFLVGVAPRNGTPLDTPPSTASTPSTGFSLIDSTDRLETVAIAIDDSSSVGIDLETTGLNWRTDRVRLMTLSCDSIGDDRQIFIVDCFQVDPSPLFEYLESKPLIGHNLAFDLAFLARMGFTPRGELRDTMLMSRVATAGTGDKNTLAACCDRMLGVTLDKAEQAGDWSRPTLRPEQLRYAAADVRTLDPLERRLFTELVNARLGEVAEIESRCLPAMNWMSTAGVPFDLDAWRELASTAAGDVKRLEAELDAIAPAVPGEARLVAAAWNWTSPAQVKQALELAGLALESTDDEALAAIDHPFAELVREHRGAVKRSTTYGTDWLKHVDLDGRVYPSWNQIGADSGRMSCSNPNMQQLPRGDYRRCVAAPAGRVLVKADYSQIELRIAAKMSGDAAMLAAYRGGEDLHAKTAQAVVGKQEITKADRQLAKALNFGLLYGMGAKGFACYAKTMYRIELSETMAKRYRDAFFRTYRGLAAWHARVRSQAVAETRTLSGRRRLLKPDTPDTQRLNTPVQGTGADGLKIALALLWERREQAVDSFPILAVHDEIVVEAPEDRADQAAAWLKAAMLDAMTPLINPVPVEVEISISNTWGKS